MACGDVGGRVTDCAGSSVAVEWWPDPEGDDGAPFPPVQVLQVWRVAELFLTNPFFLLFVYCAPSLSLVWLQTYGVLPRYAMPFIFGGRLYAACHDHQMLYQS